MLESWPGWMPKAIGWMLTVALGLLIIVLVIVATKLPSLLGDEDAATAINTAPRAFEDIGSIDEGVAGVELEVSKLFDPLTRIAGDVPEIKPSVDLLLEQVEALGVQISSLQGSTGVLSDNAKALTATAERVTKIRDDLALLQETLEDVQKLRAPVTDLAGSVRTLPELLKDLNVSVVKIATFDELLGALVTSLANIEESVGNLDRKTGPVLLPDFNP